MEVDIQCFPMFNLSFSTVVLNHVVIFQDVFAANQKFVGIIS